MIADVLQLVPAAPFEPFVVVTSSGRRCPVPGAGHAGANPQRTRVVIWFGDGSGVTVSGLHITAVEKETSTRAD